MRAARDLAGDDFNIVAVIGDGAMTGGLAYEALNNVSRLKSPLVIVLNDNDMSISKNIGGISHYLTRLRTAPAYKRSKKRFEGFLNKIPKAGPHLANGLRRFKNSLKYLLSPGTFFESLDIFYMGPVDGHNLQELEFELSRAKNMDTPCLVHVVTKKGKGYQPAEENPSKFHGVPPFTVETGSCGEKKQDFSAIMGAALCDLAKQNEALAVVCPSMCAGCGLSEFAKQFPARLFDVGIAEAHAVTFAAGLALAGLVPVVTVYSSFLQRAFDSLIHDVAVNNLHVVIGVDRAGLVGEDGETHQGIFDISYLTQIPNMAMLSASSFAQLDQMVRYAVTTHTGPIAVRYPKGADSGADMGDFVFGKANLLKKGHSVTICAEGRMVETALAAAELLVEKGYSADVLAMGTIKPLDMDTIEKSVRKTGFLVTLENNVARGGMGEAICAALRREAIKIIKAFPDEFIPQGKVGELFARYGMDAAAVANEIEQTLRSRIKP